MDPVRRPRIALLLVILYAGLAPAADLQPGRLRCDHLDDPLGIDSAAPALSWACVAADAAARDLHQQAYQVLVASTRAGLLQERGDLWDSGRVASAQTLEVAYAGRALASLQRCWWSVRIWDQQGRPSAWSAPATFTLGMLDPARWRAAWIGVDDEHPLAVGAAPSDGPDGASFAQAQWIGQPQAGAGVDAPAGSAWYAATMNVPAGATVVRARSWLAADDRFTLLLDGAQADAGGGWARAAPKDLTGKLHAGDNQVLVEVVNASAGPSGLLGTIEAQLADGTILRLPTSAAWHAAAGSRPAAAPAAWPASARVLGAPGMAPWGATAQGGGGPVLLPAQQLRRSFTLAAPPVRAVLLASALGHVDLHLNGALVSDEHFAPGWSDYRQSAPYRAYDVTARLRAGENVLGAVLADGWFRGQISVLGQNRYGRKTRLFAELHLFAADGSEEVIASDGGWRAATGPILEGDLFAGETYDARRETAGWDAPGFDAQAWSPVVTGAEVAPRLRFYRAPPVRAQEELVPVACEARSDGSVILDLGQNIVGWARLRVEEPTGTVLTLRFAEMRNADGTLYTAALRSARATDTYVCRGGGVEAWEPRFTYHGFRFIEVRGLSAPPARGAVTGVVAHSDLALTSSFACSSPLVERIHANSWWGQRGNYLDLPTDCPQRDERMGWTGDTQVYVRTAAYHMEVAAFLGRWMDEMGDAQGADGRFPIMAPAPHAGWSPGWADAGVIVPWTVHQVYGDTRLLARHYERMCAHVRYYQARSPALIGPAEGFGDWLAVGSDTPKDLIATAYFHHSTRLLADIATALGKAADAAADEALASRIASAFQARFVKADGTIGSGSQTGYLLALRFGLLTPAQRTLAADHLVAAIAAKQDHLSTGFLGVNLLLPTLSDIGRSELAYRLLQNTSYPSWGYSVAQGATTMWERWNSYTHDRGFGDVSMNSFNHYAYGACNEWLYRTVLGIDAAAPGFTTISLAPQPGGGLTWARGHYQSLHGTIASAWSLADGACTWEVTVPANTTAIAQVPWAGDPAAVSEGGQALAQARGVQVLSAAHEPVRLRLGSGRYRFVIAKP